MHIVMANKNKESEFLYSVIAVIFSLDQSLTDKEVKEDVVDTIDNYFESLKWDDASGNVLLDEVNVA